MKVTEKSGGSFATAVQKWVAFTGGREGRERERREEKRA